MNRGFGVVFLSVCLLAGCRYTAPVTTEHTIPVDGAVLGLWEEVPGKADLPKEPQKMLVLKYSETEYLIEYPLGSQAMQFRGYPVKLDGFACVQVQLIGTVQGPVKDVDRKYDLVSYHVDGDTFEMRLLNQDLVSRELKTGDALRASVLKNNADPALFMNPSIFRKAGTAGGAAKAAGGPPPPAK